VVSGKAFARQPVAAAAIRSDEVEIDGRPLAPARAIPRTRLSMLPESRFCPWPHPGFSYDAWVHVWNLGRSPVGGVRVRVDLGPTNRFLGGRQLDLADRLREGSHRVVKDATFAVGQPGDSAIGKITAVAECPSDVAGDDRGPGMDRHRAHRQVCTSGI
jgi:hypothetical protein